MFLIFPILDLILVGLGEPVLLSSEQLVENVRLSTQAMEEEQFRSSRPHRGEAALVLSSCLARDPDDGETAISSGLSQNSGLQDFMDIYKLLPHLSSLPDSLLKKLPLSAALQLNAALQKESKTVGKLSTNAKLSQNMQKLLQMPLKIEGGTDNRKNQLHPARFLGGASCSKQDMWLLARRVLGDKGVAPIGNYDMDSIGCGGCVTPKAWLEIHNPSSQELKLKHFYLPNVGGSGLSAKKVALADGEDALSIGESLKEIADMEGFRAALSTAREAMATALPWNHSLAAVVGFMLNSNYCQSDLQGNNRRAQILTEFVDYVIGRNALNWENSQPFLSTDELTHVWTMWKGKRSALFAVKFGERNERNWKKREFLGPKDICRRYNVGKCAKQADKDCTTSFGTKLKHCCNYLDRSGKACEKDHPRIEHK